MYGTLRHQGRSHGHDGMTNGQEHTCGLGLGPPGSVVPPPPMFEEGNIGSKTPLIAQKQKCVVGKKPGEKKDKMESRV